MIRPVRTDDCTAIANIYNEYVLNSTATFETEVVTIEEMYRRIDAISCNYPYFVYEENGNVVGYCYAHAWKERAAYSKTLETTIYVENDSQGKGIGLKLLKHLIEECRTLGYEVLVACITAENTTSCDFHRKMGFKQVSLFEKVGIKFGRHLDVVDYIFYLREKF